MSKLYIMLAKVKVGFKALSIPVKIEFANKISLAITGNINFKDPKPSMVEMNAAIKAVFDAAQAASEGGISKTATLHIRVTALEVIISKIAAYVQSESGGDEEKIRSAGFDVRKTAAPATNTGQVHQLVTITSAYSGSISLKWKSTKVVKSYMIEKSDDGNTGWVTCGNSTKASIEIGGLTTMTYVWFRVTAINAAGQSPASAAVRALVA